MISLAPRRVACRHGPPMALQAAQVKYGLLCTQEQKAGSGTNCQAWITAARAALNGLSGRDGASNFFCPPATGLDAKSTTQLLADEVARETRTQATRPAAEVLAEALARQFPCVPPKSEEAVAIFHRALEIFEASDGK